MDIGVESMNIALFVDCNSIKTEYIDAITREARKQGNVIMKKAYGNIDDEELRDTLERNLYYIEETADEAMNFGKPKIGDAVVESGPLVGKDGSGKDDRADGKLRWDLLPLAEIEDIVRVYTEGAKKYADNSWQNIPDGFERYRAALLRHMTAYMKGERYDKETGLMHLAQICWNAIALLYYDKHNKGLIEWKDQEK